MWTLADVLVRRAGQHSDYKTLQGLRQATRKEREAVLMSDAFYIVLTVCATVVVLAVINAVKK